MKRRDLILFRALANDKQDSASLMRGEGNVAISSPIAPLCSLITSKVGTDVKDAGAENVLMPSPITPLFSPITPKVGTFVEEDGEENVAIPSPIAPLYSPTTLKVGRVVEDADDGYVAIESPIAPLYSPITPKVGTVVEDTGEGNVAIPSPVAPLYSPVTFKVGTIIEDDSNKHSRECSPLPSMSPSTLKQFNAWADTLEGDFSDEYSNKDPSYNYIPESDSSDEELIAQPQNNICFKAIVHERRSNKEKEKETTKTNQYRHTISLPEDELERIEPLYDGEENQGVKEINQGEEQISEGIRSTQVTKGRPKKGRKRKYNDYTLVERKTRRYNNLPYQGKRKEVKSKVFKEYACTCSKQCFLLVDKDKREAEFNKYVTLGSYEAQLLYILSCVKESKKKRCYTTTSSKTGKIKSREFSRTYTLCGIPVCRDMFINTIQVTPQKVTISLKKNRSGNEIKDQRGKSQGGWNKTPEEDIAFICNIINKLPKYESHYRRSSNNDTMYLQPTMSIEKIYDLYLDELKETYGNDKKKVSSTVLKKIFYKKFNLKFKRLKKDTCNKCDTFSARLKNSISDEERERLLSQKEEHLKSADDLRAQMDVDMKRAQTDVTFECITFDMEKTLPLPRIPTNIVFYKRQLWFYNCGVHAASTDTGYCFVWVEGEAGRGAQEVGSCLRQYIQNKLKTNIEHLALWSDCCGGQNRNIKIVLILKTVLEFHPSLKTISLKFLESGHTFLPNDTDFSNIESQLKYHQRIYTAQDYIDVIKSSKKKNPLKVIRMKSEDFIGTKQLEKNIINRKTANNKIKVSWLKTKEILLKKEHLYSIFMRTTKEEEFREVIIEKKVKGKSLPITQQQLGPLWPEGKPIAQPKLDDLKSMFHLIPDDCLEFYKSLKGTNNIIDDIDGFGQPDFDIENEQNLEEA